MYWSTMSRKKSSSPRLCPARPAPLARLDHLALTARLAPLAPKAHRVSRGRLVLRFLSRAGTIGHHRIATLQQRLLAQWTLTQYGILFASPLRLTARR